MNKTLMLAAAGFALTTSAHGAIIFQDTFDTEAGAAGASSLNYNSFANWTVSEGYVDVVADGAYGIGCAGGSGKCVDLDGSRGNAGTLTSTALSLGPGDYLLSFDISGNQRGGAADSLAVSLGGFFSDTFNLSPSAPWMTVTHAFSVAALEMNSFIFNHAGGDNIGIMLDNVTLESVDDPTAVSEPATWVFFGLGLAGLGYLRRQSPRS